jgi:protein-histidine pros-kinase
MAQEDTAGADEARLLHESAMAEARFRGLVEVAPDAIVTVDSKGRLVLVNGQTEALFGYQRQELLGQPVELLLPERFQLGHVSHRTNYVHSPRIRPMGSGLELLGRRKDGTEFPVEISLGPVETDGDLLIIATIRDVTERKRVEETLKRQTAQLRHQADLIDLANDAIIVITPDRSIVSWNRGSQKLYGWTSQEAVGRPLHELLQARYPESREAVDEALSRDGKWEGELAHIRKDGEQVLVESHQIIVQEQDGSVEGILAINRDITERRRAEEQSEAARREAEEANRAKSEFLSRMSHELRTPLNAILGFSQLLSLEQLTDEQTDSVDHILKAGRHLLELINEVLDISRIEAGRLSLSLEPVSVDEVLRETLDLVRPMAQERSISLHEERREDGVHVLADRQRIRQVLLNLLTNAVKYNQKDGDVRITTATTAEGRFRISVSDTGSGIDAEKKSRVFTPFDRLGAEQGDVEGTGLGLALSKALMDAMGGTIGVESTPGLGSTFWLELPRADSLLQGEEIAADGAGVEAALPEARAVLYIEDNVPSAQLMERIFSRWPNVKLISAMQGGLGVDLARQHRPDLILLDLHLPDIHGLEVLQRLRLDPGTHQIPVVVTSADATPGQIARLRAAGADEYLTKPLDIIRFSEVVRKFLK